MHAALLAIIPAAATGSTGINRQTGCERPGRGRHYTPAHAFAQLPRTGILQRRNSGLARPNRDRGYNFIAAGIARPNVPDAAILAERRFLGE
jgi:hypothetical protein